MTARADWFSQTDACMFSNNFMPDWLNVKSLTNLLSSGEAGERPSPLAPTDSVAGRSLVIVISIMTFLASLALGAALLVADASTDWRKDVAREASIQVRSMPNRDLEADVRAATAIAAQTEGVAEARAFTRAESEALLAPWLGEGMDLSELPTPRMIVLRFADGRRPDFTRLKAELDRAVPSAALDDHRLWIERLSAMAGASVAIATGVFLLIVAAMAIAIGSATRAAVGSNREIIAVLHMVGAADAFIAREFQRRFLALGLRGALIGGGAAIAFFIGANLLTTNSPATPGADQVEALFGVFSLGLSGYAAIAALAGAIVLLTGHLSKWIVMRHLWDMD